MNRIVQENSYTVTSLDAISVANKWAIPNDAIPPMAINAASLRIFFI